ncbi:MAG TPA: S1C family serine protease [Polyangiaceae bacterium]|nr:S1C family serine protease [Polyangiaceae bacterium]
MTQATSRLSEQLAAAADQASQSLVHVAATCRRGATASLYDDDGVILTTARAVAGRDHLEILQADQSVEAKVIGYDAATDIGLLRSESPIGRAPSWSDTPVRLGSLLLAGSRPGRAVRVHLGMVSQLGDSWHTGRGGRIERYVETDLEPEPGFSGGLAFDVEGRALGMNSAGLLRGLPLLVEKPTLERIVAALLANGRVRRGYLGVGTQAVGLPDALAQSSGQRTGLLVSSVQPQSAADKAHLLIGDLLLTLGSTPLKDAQALQAALEDAEGQRLTLALVRAGQQLLVDVTPGARP